ncbi:unnamed protein product (macronuclear) [Paramecium tetraurelia]|uniref:H-type lectin domain-containing protein n=1 Tax=Paramecium tetraurelia TaxID=5888 RepID=A0DFV7_PARTE|nr:uncharacterized protein GSPATT00039486001 [Paramecium tetraurelia]CAK81924.1 unnamed protein product [Paramecium tetraurelia]|eukprot:XP_001449321.1 hypothetical protein (macronuclear) [Paramecium tetraurelia strain d4-2]
MFYIIYQVFSVLANHKYEYGFVNHFSYSSNPNLNLYLSLDPFRQHEYYISFSKQFTQVPDVYLNIAKLDLEYTFPQGYSLDIFNISTLGFTIRIVCESPSRFYRVEFNWFAFNEENIQVISNLNITNPKSSYIHSYNKNNKINIAKSNFVSYYASDSQFNNLTGLTLTQDTVTISFQLSNIKQIGYQILLSSSDIFFVGPVITSLQSDGSSQVINFPTRWGYQHCYFNLLGFKHDETDKNIRLYTQVTYQSQITVGIVGGDSIIQSIQNNHFCINDPYFEIAIFKGVSQSRFFHQENQIDSLIEIKEINYSQNQNLIEQITIAKEIESIKIIFYWKCMNKEFLKLTIFSLEEWCSQSTIIKCDIVKIKTVRIQAKFLLKQISEQYLNIAKTSGSLTASQVLKWENPFEQVLVKLEIL